MTTIAALFIYIAHLIYIGWRSKKYQEAVDKKIVEMRDRINNIEECLEATPFAKFNHLKPK